jgi:hypothetical protein
VIRRGPRSIAIGGLLLVLLTTIACDRWKSRLRVESKDAPTRAAVRTALPASAFRVRWDSHTVPATIARGSSTDARIGFTNVGDTVWPDVLAADPAAHSGGYAVRLAYQWAPASAAPAGKPGRRADLPHPLHAGETMTLLVPLDAPNEPGEYRLTFELVQELVAWFDTKGAATLVVPVTVQ